MHFHLIVITVLSCSSFTYADPDWNRIGHARGPVFNAAGLETSPVGIPINPVPFKSYEFGYELGDGLGMTQHRREVADGSGAVKGSYGYLDPLGVTRLVEYIADNNGFRAVVRSNEPGIAGQNAADAVFIVQPPTPAAVARGIHTFIPVVSA